jgi:transposase
MVTAIPLPESPMPRYKEANYAQGQFIPIQFEHQIMPGSFEHALSCIVDHKLDLTHFFALRHNDAGGAPSYDPRVMLEIVLCAYARGLISSGDIAAACGQNVVFMALSANSRPHFTTIAQFLREMGRWSKGCLWTCCSIVMNWGSSGGTCSRWTVVR